MTRMGYGKDAKLAAGTEYLAIKDTLIRGEEVTMRDYVGDLIDELGDKGFKVLAFPCNQFLSQEPGGEPEIVATINKFGGMRDRLILFSKADVNGAKARPVFTYLKEALPFKDGTTNVQWNFGKFLIDHEGTPVKRYGSKTEPFKMKADIEALLAKRNGETTTHEIVQED
ncbi:MAG: hypothetical protein SGBAC_012698 [Bacillariaceae sp.]